MTGKIQRLPYPTGIILDIHNYCNARCIICPYTKLQKKIPHGVMSWELYTKIINDYHHLMEQYTFQGKLTYCQMGEPFVIKDISKWVKYAIDRNIEVYFNTNASLLTPSVVDSLIDAGYHGLFNISFFGITKKIYEDIMGLNYDNTINNIEYLLKNYPRKQILINAVNYHWPKGEKQKVLKYWRERNVQVTVSKPLSRSGLIRNLGKTTQKRIAGCGTERVLFEIVVSFDGKALLCCHDMAREVILGDLKNSTIYEVWNGKKFQDILNAIYTGKNLSPDFICLRCEESVPYWSIRRTVKNLMPDRMLKEIRKRRDYKWIVSKKT
ncbi:MAG: radical SAM/SPASM domain-containing protein [Candidatus Scalindua sp.]